MGIEQHQFLDGAVDPFTDIGMIRPCGDGKALCEQLGVHRGFRAVIDGSVNEGVDFAVLEHGNDVEKSFGGDQHEVIVFMQPVGME
jgi:hypothetical protein